MSFALKRLRLQIADLERPTATGLPEDYADKLAELADLRKQEAALQAACDNAISVVQAKQQAAESVRTMKETMKLQMTADRALAGAEHAIAVFDAIPAEPVPDENESGKGSGPTETEEVGPGLSESELYYRLSPMWARRGRDLASALSFLQRALRSTDISGRLCLVDPHGVTEYQP